METPAPSKANKVSVPSLLSVARIEFADGDILLEKNHLTGALAVTAAGWGTDSDPHPTTVLWDKSPLVGQKADNKKRPVIGLPNCLIEFLKDHPDFAPNWMRSANAVVFYETNPPPNHGCGAPQVRVLTFTSGKPKIELRLDRSFMPHDRIAGFDCIELVAYEHVSPGT